MKQNRENHFFVATRNPSNLSKRGLVHEARRLSLWVRQFPFRDRLDQPLVPRAPKNFSQNLSCVEKGSPLPLLSFLLLVLRQTKRCGAQASHSVIKFPERRDEAPDSPEFGNLIPESPKATVPVRSLRASPPLCGWRRLRRSIHLPDGYPPFGQATTSSCFLI